MHCVQNADIFKFRRVKFGHVRWGIFDSGKSAVATSPLLISSRLLISRPYHRPASNISVPALTVEGDMLWGGAFFSHFGHFITETLPALVYLAPLLSKYRELNAIFLRPPIEDGEWLLPHVSWFLEKLSIDPSRLLILDQDARVSCLRFPKLPFQAGGAYTRDLPSALDEMGLAPSRGSKERIWISRDNIGRSRIKNIEQIEEEVHRAGLTILAPEKLGLAEQIDRMCSAELLAGENGSGLHWSLYSPFARKIVSLGWKLSLQERICSVRGQELSLIRTPILGPFKSRRQSVPVSQFARAIAQ
ncbi:MAG: glycosyltransferase family 61 protein [Paracoccaceae bacterium]